ncbi:MAG: redoxin domain-containing protein [Phycisphaerales bacterium]|nr:MAG: redoxin domain-containing protein [Phycisphaerales bacterium]
MTNTYGRLIAAVVVGLLVGPAWADCGFCASGSQQTEENKHSECPHHKAHAGHTASNSSPDFTLNDLDGDTYKLSDLKGKVVVLEWVNHECPFTNRFVKNGTVKKIISKFSGNPFVWLGIDSSHFAESKKGAIRKWAGDNKVDYPILLDASGEVGRAFKAKTTPHIFVIDQQGKVAYNGAFDDDAYDTKSKKHNYVEEAVTALLNDSTVATATTKSYGCSVKYKSK